MKTVSARALRPLTIAATCALLAGCGGMGSAATSVSGTMSDFAKMADEARGQDTRGKDADRKDRDAKPQPE